MIQQSGTGLRKPVLRSRLGLLRAGIWLRIRRNWQLYALLLIPLIWLIVFRYAPMYGAQIAFKKYTPCTGY